MILLVTGRPGAGKTLWTVAEIARRLPEWQSAGRDVFTDINGLTLQGVQRLPGPAREWPTLPDRSVVILDECQRSFPPRNIQSSVPGFISAFETHRHRGLDFVLITQGPKLLDRHLHDLVDNHVHLYRPFGWDRSTVYRWQGINLSPDPAQSRSTAQTENFRFPKHLFSAYRSAQEHFVKKRIPWAFVALMVAGLLLVSAGAYFGLGRVMSPPSATTPLQTGQDALRPSLAALCAFRVGGVSYTLDRVPCSADNERTAAAAP